MFRFSTILRTLIILSIAAIVVGAWASHAEPALAQGAPPQKYQWIENEFVAIETMLNTLDQNARATDSDHNLMGLYHDFVLEVSPDNDDVAERTSYEEMITKCFGSKWVRTLPEAYSCQFIQDDFLMDIHYIRTQLQHYSERMETYYAFRVLIRDDDAAIMKRRAEASRNLAMNRMTAARNTLIKFRDLGM